MLQHQPQGNCPAGIYWENSGETNNILLTESITPHRGPSARGPILGKEHHLDFRVSLVLAQGPSVLLNEVTRTFLPNISQRWSEGWSFVLTMGIEGFLRVRELPKGNGPYQSFNESDVPVQGSYRGRDVEAMLSSAGSLGVQL